MKRLLVLPLLLLTFGCARNHFNVPVEHFSDKVRVLGVAPIMVDSDSDIRYPRKDMLLPLVADTNRTYETQVVRKLKGTGNFYTVALLDGDPAQIFSNLFFRREKRDDATIRYNKYFWKAESLRDYIRRNNLDAVMLIVVSGLEMTDKVSSDTLLKSMTGDFNYLIMTAQILDADGTILWEYPNFRTRILSYDPLINLQYPDFSESDANLSAETNIKFKTIEGVRRALDQKRKDLLRRETAESEVYARQFDEMLSYLKYDADTAKKDAHPVAGPSVKSVEPLRQPALPEAKQASVAGPAGGETSPVQQTPAPAPVAARPVQPPVPAAAPPAAAAPSTAASGASPAKGTTP
ncbi:MAG TPA: hypothetical protein VF795_13275 [Desulfuromonadaceae bacterium]